MADQVFKSPGVYSREIDLSFTGPTEPFGTPAGVVGTAQKGPAFVPVTVASFRDFVDTFGNVDTKKFGPYAIKEFLRNAQAGVYVRVLGAGDGKQRETSPSDLSNNAGRVNNAGFLVGGSGTVGTSFNHQRDANRDSVVDAPGRAYFLGALHSQSAGSTYLSDANIQFLGNASARALLRGVLFAASGTVLRLSGTAVTGVGVQQKDYNNITGTLRYVDTSFTLVVSGHTNTTDYPRFVTGTMDPNRKDYFGNVFNRDPLKVRNHGYVLYESFDVPTSLAVITGTSIYITSGSTAGTNDSYADIVWLTTGTAPYNQGTATVPNYENFEERFTTPASPFVISQKFGGSQKDLFKIESLSDGEYANNKYKISIANVKRSTAAGVDFGSFSLLIRDFNDTDENPVVLEKYHNLNLDRNSPNYVAKRIGDLKVRFDFDQPDDAQKVIEEGEYDNVSKLIRIVVSDDLKNGNLSDTCLPVGFRGIKYLVTSGSARLTAPSLLVQGGQTATNPTLQSLVASTAQPPVPFRNSLSRNSGNKKQVDSRLYWGVQFRHPAITTDQNKNGGGVRPNGTSFIEAYTKFFGSDNLTSTQTAVTGSDTFNNNLFTLENIQVLTKSAGNVADESRIQDFVYVRHGTIANADGTRSLDVTKDLNTLSNYAKFTFFLQGGFDGVNIFDSEFKNLEDGAAVKEAGVSALQRLGPTIGSYMKAIDVISNPDMADIHLLAVPGITEPIVTNHALEKTEDRFDAIYIMDVQLRDSQKNIVTASAQNVSTRETINDHESRGLNSNFGAAYYPDVTIFDPANRAMVDVPPSVVVLGAFAFNDKVGQPWTAAAGFNRGALDSVTKVRVPLTLSDRDNLQVANINPIASFTGKGAVVFGQKTLQQAQSALDRVNVRRLLIEVRRAVKRVSNLIIFEPNRDATLQRFNKLVNPILERIQAQAGVERFKVLIDNTTTTQADVENNVIRGQIRIQPTRTIEAIALDFVVTNQGAEF